MPKLKIVGCRYGCQKVEMTKILRDRLSIGLAAAKKCTDAVLNGEIVSFDFADYTSAKELANELENIGAVVEIEVD